LEREVNYFLGAKGAAGVHRLVETRAVELPPEGFNRPVVTLPRVGVERPPDRLAKRLCRTEQLRSLLRIVLGLGGGNPLEAKDGRLGLKAVAFLRKHVPEAAESVFAQTQFDLGESEPGHLLEFRLPITELAHRLHRRKQQLSRPSRFVVGKREEAEVSMDERQKPSVPETGGESGTFFEHRRGLLLRTREVRGDAASIEE
jgi:hypothetical protein